MTPKIGFDCDGCIVEGKYVAPPHTWTEYMALDLYDNYTKDVWDSLWQYDTYVISSRSIPEAAFSIDIYLRDKHMRPPLGIIAEIDQDKKADLVAALGLKYFFDDSPLVYRESCERVPTYLMDNPYWPENQALDTINRITSWKQIGDLLLS